jgi:hypothetical protein
MLVGVRLMVGQQTLDLFVEVRILYPQQNKKSAGYQPADFLFPGD